MATSMTPLVRATGLCKRYVDGPSVVEVLLGLDLDVFPGDRIAVVGASGVGKSTLLHILGCLDRPTDGQVVFDGRDAFAGSDAEMAAFRSREIGFVFQFHQLLGDFTALENVELAGRIGREPRAAVRARATELLERVGLGPRLRHRPGELSGGEQQRVAVARAVMRRPRLVLADEPTGNLDPATGERVQDLLVDLNRETGAALVVATHNERFAGTLGRCLRLEHGRLVDAPRDAPWGPLGAEGQRA
jgi:lipoprotein-releasing system ATP-binding protein